MSNETASITVDMAFGEESLEETLDDVRKTFGVEATVEQERGPAAGWPVVRLTGTKDRLRDALALGWLMDADDIAMYLD